jgi:uncharacterized protein (TIGR02687 family)
MIVNTPQLTDNLRRIFDEEKHRLVFWYDAKREFEDSIGSLDLNGVTVLRLDETGALELKIRLEIEDTEGAYLLYAPYAEPAPEVDWLLDVRLYSRTFYADKSSILLDELELELHSLREHLARRQLFFRSQDRQNRLKKWVRSDDREAELDRKMLAVLVRAEQPENSSILIKLFGELCQQGECDLSSTPRSWSEIEKYDLKQSFWDLMKQMFGYDVPEPKLTDLLIRLLVTDFARTLKGDVPQPLRHFVLPNRTRALDASVFIDGWRRDVGHYANYDVLAKKIEDETKLDDHVAGLDDKYLSDCFTFEAVERRVIKSLRDQVVDTSSHLDLESFRALIQKRRDGHWARGADNTYRLIYDALEAAAQLLNLRDKYARGLSYPSAEEMFAAYRDELYRFDQLYRLFHEAADQVEQQGIDVLKSLSTVVESCYANWFIDQLATTWGAFIDPAREDGLLRSWSLDGVPNHQDFYRKHVNNLLEASTQSKVYVVISDAFRYEAAEELTRELNGKNRFAATLGVQLGVLPSYTALGMAALLPHQKLDYKLGANLDVTADDVSTTGFANRTQILARVNGTAIKYDDLLAMNKEQGREFAKPWRVIYIYHNQVDAIGDSASTESKTFSAVRTAINELSSVVRFVINNLNSSQILITADHGFLFQETAPTQVDRSGLDERPAGTRLAKKRYLIGTELGERGNIWHGRAKTTAGIAGEMEFWIPKGANRFHFTGGARFVHGGAMPQEIVVPIITVKGLRGQAAEKSTVRQVDVSLLGSTRRVVNNVQRFEFIQTDAVSDRVQPRTLLISLRDDETLISNEATLTFDSQSSSMDERRKTAQLILKSGQYDKKHVYALVLRDADTQIEYARVPMTIDLTLS